MAGSPARLLTSITLLSALTLTVSGCSFVEDLLPSEEQPTVTIFEDPSDIDNTPNEPTATPDSNNSASEELQEPTQSTVEPEQEPDIEPAPEPANQVAAEEIITIAAAFDYLDEITAYAANTCTSQDLLGSSTDVRITNTESGPEPYTILFIPEAEADKPERRAIAYYPTVPNNLNPELLENHNAHACGLAAYYPATLTEAFQDTELSDPLPAGIKLSKSGNRYTINLPEATHLLTISQGLIVESSIIKPEATTTRVITHQIQPTDLQLFEGLVKFLIASR